MASNDEDFHALTDSESAIAELNQSDVIKLRLYARAKLVFNSRELSEDELISEALARTLKGDRRWNTNLTIVQHLIGTMKSIASDQRRTKSAEVEVLIGEDQASYEVETNSDPTILIDNQVAVETIFKTFQSDNESLIVLKGLLAGEKRSETISKTSLSDLNYGAARKRITRKVLMMRERGQI
ncbi:MAG: hypothetical protein QM500_10175 [Methylococcales bacterium]